MLCGKQPFPGNNVTAILYRLVHMEPIEPDNLEMNGLIPHKWHEVFPKVLSKKRENRYQAAAEFVRDLEYCLGSWFTGLGDDVVPTTAVAAPPIPAAPAQAGAPPAQPPAAAPPAPPPVMARKAEDPSVVVSMDEIQEAVGYAAPQRPAGPALPEDDDLPPTVSVSRPAMDELDDLPPTMPIQRPAIEQTIVLPSNPPAAAPAAAAPPVTAAPAHPATPPVVTKPASKPPFKPASPVSRPGSNPPYRPASVPPYRSPAPLGAPRSQAPRIPGPASRVPAESPLEHLLETEQVERPAPGRKLWIGAAAALLVILVGVGVWISRRGAPGRNLGGGTGAVTGTGNGVINVESTPPGARISLNEQALGTAPTSLKGLAAGTYEVVAELPGHEPAFETVALREGTPAAVKLTLQASRTAMSDADILSRPSGASVTVDGERMGLTPLRGIRLRVGNRRVRLATDGYVPFVQFLTVDEGRSARLDARLVQVGASAPPATAPPATPASAAAPPSGAASPAALASVRPSQSPSGGPATKPSASVAAASPAAAAAPTTTLPVPTTTLAAAAPAAPTKPQVDTAKVYMETEVDTQPRKLSGDTHSPKLALKSGETRSVTLSWVVGEGGEVTDVEVVESGGKELDEPVMQSVRKWKYAAGTKQGVKVKVRLGLKFTFKAG
jgi:TonB family protein